VSAADGVAGTILLGLVLYGVFGGADFGSGVWDLLAGRGRRGDQLRRLVDHAIGPVWEANHVWLVFVLVFTWTGFPDVFVLTVDVLFVPLALAALGIVLRGAAFAFRKFAADFASAQVYGVVFAGSSVITPFALGTAAGAIASGRVVPDTDVDRWTVWLAPTSLLGGVLAVLVCAFLAAVFLAREAEHLGRDDLAAWCRTRALATAVITGVVALAGIAVLAADAPTLFDGLTGRALPLLVISGLGGLTTIWALLRRHHGRARVSAAVAVAAVIAGWGVGQYPALLVDQFTIEQAAGAPVTMVALLVTFVAAAVIVLPSLGWLLVLLDRGALAQEGPSRGPGPGSG